MKALDCYYRILTGNYIKPQRMVTVDIKTRIKLEIWQVNLYLFSLQEKNLFWIQIMLPWRHISKYSNTKLNLSLIILYTFHSMEKFIIRNKFVRNLRCASPTHLLGLTLLFFFNFTICFNFIIIEKQRNATQCRAVRQAS